MIEKIKDIIKLFIELINQKRLHNSPGVYLLIIGVGISIVCTYVISMLIEFEMISLFWGKIIFVAVPCLYMYAVLHVKKGSIYKSNLYNMVITDSNTDHKTIRRQFQDKLKGNVEFEKNFNIIHPIYLHRLYYEFLFSNNAHGSFFTNHYNRRICKKGKNPIIIDGYINEKGNKPLTYEYNIKVSFFCYNINQCNFVRELRIISNAPTQNLMPLIEFIRMCSNLIKIVENISDASSFSSINDLFVSIKNCKLATDVEDFKSNIILPICDYICSALININRSDSSVSKSKEYTKLCKLISSCDQQNSKIQTLNEICTLNELNNIINSNDSDKKKKKAITKTLNSAKPPPDNKIISSIFKKFKKG